jgi:hypothetical protein
MSAIRRFVIVLGVAAAFLAASVFAADANAPPKKPEKLKGTISVTKDPNNVVTAITLTTVNKTVKTVYHVILNKKAEELGSLNGKDVEVQCVVIEKGDQKLIKVQEFQLVEKKTKSTKGTKK